MFRTRRGNPERRSSWSLMHFLWIALQRIGIAFASQRILQDAKACGTTQDVDAARKLSANANLAAAFLADRRIPEAQHAATGALTAVQRIKCLSADSHEKARIIKLMDSILRLRGNSEVQYPKPNGRGYELYPVGTHVRIATEDDLREFMATWKFHHPLEEAQVDFAGHISTVSHVSYYHGGDVLYQLRDTAPYTWHESCLSPVT